MQSIYFCGVLTILVLSHSPLASSQENDDEREWDYLKDSSMGPEHWGDLNVNWTVCKTGVWQSPIDLRDGWADVVRHLGRRQTSYKPAYARLMNRGHDIMCHWHSPSEHHINGWWSDLEVHMVHQSMDERIAVVGILYKIGFGEDPFLRKVCFYY
ncbi:hypothetical protein MRB53_004727 [Persea americana]|uniref:Uncharacterized protein n=1 Tax=Persea americana TaxID=3435 RepID=A0ACC2MBH8_PERAE|nr:hypothetical protein MRB53_004727 [Persea americana]